MLIFDSSQMVGLERRSLAEAKRKVVLAICQKYPTVNANAKASVALDEFARRSMEAARAVRIDKPQQMQRFCTALFYLAFIVCDETKLRHFSQVMLSEQAAESRLLFVENSLVN